MNFIAVCFFFTGATALALEVLWSKHLSYLLGNSLFATSTVIGSYMLGLALGSGLLSRGYFKNQPPFKFFGLIQMFVGVYGALSLLIFNSTEGLLKFFYLHVHDQPNLFLALRFVVFFFLITLPVIFMGMTLPLLTSGLKETSYERHGSFLYALNTWGAVLGSLVVAYLMIPHLGLSKSCYALGIVDFLIGLVIFLKFRSEAVLATETVDTERAKFSLRWALVFIFSIGFLNILCELSWYRYLTNIFGGSVYAFTNVLAVYLTGLALGSYLEGRYKLEQQTFTQSRLVHVLSALAITSLVTLYAYNYIPLAYLEIFQFFNGGKSIFGILVSQLLTAAIIVLPTTICMGALLPVLIRYVRLKENITDARSGVGAVYGSLTLGNVVGSLLGGFYLIPFIGFFNTLKVFGVIIALLALIISAWTTYENKKQLWSLCAPAIIAVLIILKIPNLDLQMLNQGFFDLARNPKLIKTKEQSKNTSLIFYKEGVNVSVAVLGNEFGDGGLGLRVSSKGEAHTSPQGRRHLLLLGHLPMLFADYPKDVAVIGYGGGMTAHSVLTHSSVKSMDILEFEPGVIQAASYFDLINEKPLEDPRSRLIVEDGRIHLTYTDKKYDVITTDPISPWIAGSANLYSVNFYELAKKRLNKRGLVCQWVQLGDFSEDSFKVILNSMRKVFSNVNIFIYSDDAVIIASEHSLYKSWESLQTRFSQPNIKRDFSENDIHSLETVLNYYFADTASVDRYLKQFPLVSDDDNVFLEYTLPFELYLKRGNLGRQIATQFIQGRHSRLQKLANGLPNKQMIQAEFSQFLDEFSEIPEEILKDVVSDPHLSGLERQALTQQFKKLPNLPQKSKDYEFLWLRLRQAAANNDEKEQIRLLQEIRKSTFSRGYINATLQQIYLHLKRGEDDLVEKLIVETKKRSPALKEIYEVELKLLGKRGDRYGQMMVAEEALKYIPQLVFSRESKF